MQNNEIPIQKNILIIQSESSIIAYLSQNMHSKINRTYSTHLKEILAAKASAREQQKNIV